MKNILHLFKLLLITVLIVSCSSSDDKNPEQSDVFGTIELTGPDTSTIGNSLIVANIDADGLNLTGTPNSVVLLDESITVEDGELVPTDFQNSFIIVAAQFTSEDPATTEKAISMLIIKDGEEFRYVCTTPQTTPEDNTDCGEGFSVDKNTKRVIFDDTTVINVDSGAILNMNGTIVYN